MQVMMLGLPGAGKGTQAGRIHADYGIPHISTGDMFRAAIAAQTPLGREAQQYLDSGRLVPDELTIGIVRDRLQESDATAGFVLDGFPRTLPQAQALDDMLGQLNKRLGCVLYIHVPQEALLARLTGRRLCKSCGATYHLVYQPPAVPMRCDVCGGELYQRSDDTEEAVATRLEHYAQTEPLVDYYRAQGLLRQVDGEQAIDTVYSDIKRVLEDVQSRLR